MPKNLYAKNKSKEEDEKLQQCLAQLTHEEQKLIFTLFFQNKSEHQLAAETGIPRMTIHNRKKRILDRLKKLMEN